MAPVAADYLPNSERSRIEYNACKLPCKRFFRRLCSESPGGKTLGITISRQRRLAELRSKPVQRNHPVPDKVWLIRKVRLCVLIQQNQPVFAQFGNILFQLHPVKAFHRANLH
jgi:hypothetical protein